MSGGTTEAVLVEPVEGDKMFRTRLVASSLDLKAGQVIGIIDSREQDAQLQAAKARNQSASNQAAATAAGLAGR